MRIDAANPDWQLETAYASQNLGVVQLDGGRIADALQSFSRTRDVLSGLVAKRPAVAFELADAHGWIAKARDASGDFAAAIEAQQARLDVFRAMPDAAKDKRIVRNAANAGNELARLKLILGDAQAAEADARAAVEQTEMLVVADASNLFWLSEACFNRLRLAEIELALGKRDAVRPIIERTALDVSRLVASDASLLNWQVNLGGHLLAQKAQLAQAESRRPPGDEIEAYLSKVRALEASGKQLTRVQAEIVAGVELIAGDIMDREGRRDAAHERWDSAAKRLQPQATNGDLAALTLRARAAWRLGDLAQARAQAAQVEASKYRHPAYAGLVNELARAGRQGRFIQSGRK